MKEWIEINDEYVSGLGHLTRKKIRLQGRCHIETWALWDRNERCFFWNDGEDAVYMDDPNNRPTHILVG